MNPKTIFILAATLLGAGLLAGGAYMTITNLINPEGYLFEGTMMMAVGAMLYLLILITTTIGRVIVIFSEILAKQNQIHQQRMEQKGGSSISDLLSGMIPGNMIIKDLNNPDHPGHNIPLGDKDSIGRISEIFGKGLSSSKKKLQDMNLDELQKELAAALKKDDFERAGEINREIKVRQDSDGQGNSKKSE